MSHGTEKIVQALRRLLANGPLAHLPLRPEDMDVLLALAAAKFVPGRAYRERDVNDVLSSWLETFCLPGGADHVTLRRALVDARLLARDAAGTTYEARTQAVAERLADAAGAPEPAELLAAIRREREARKREHAR